MVKISLFKYRKQLLNRNTVDYFPRTLDLKEDVKQWLRDSNIEHNIEYKTWTEEDQPGIFFSRYELHIHNDEDAVLFKLVWL